MEELEFYKKLQRTRDSFVYPQALHHKHDDGDVSTVLQDVEFDLVRLDGHKPLLSKGSQGLYKVKERGLSSFALEGENLSADQVTVNPLKPFYPRLFATRG